MDTKHRISAADAEFLRRFQACEIAPDRFHHREHVQLSYVHQVVYGSEAGDKFRAGLQAFLVHYGIDPAKYHETMTQAWMLAVRHFMDRCAAQPDAAGFIEANAELLNKEIMLTHYSRELLASPQARRQFVEPNLQPIPRSSQQAQTR